MSNQQDLLQMAAIKNGDEKFFKRERLSFLLHSCFLQDLFHTPVHYHLHNYRVFL